MDAYMSLAKISLLFVFVGEDTPGFDSSLLKPDNSEACGTPLNLDSTPPRTDEMDMTDSLQDENNP